MKNKDKPVIITGFRHGDCLKTLCYFADISKVIAEEQGFLTSKNRFVNRIEAKRIAKKEFQLIRASPYRELISEDLY